MFTIQVKRFFCIILQQMEKKILIVGLGNPGKKYQYTRHNIGFVMLDSFKEEFFSIETWKEKYQGLYISSSLSIEQEKIKVVVLKPQTFMNLSGNSVCACIKSENISIDNVIVLHDELELPFGEVRWKEGGGHRGHNGLRDIIQKCGSEFSRIRIGVGRPKDNTSVADYLLSNFYKEELEQLPDIFQKVKNILIEKIPFLISTKELT